MLRMRAHEPSTLGTLAFILWGLIAWGLQFTTVYIGHTLLCALGAPPGMTDAAVAVLTAIAVIAILPVAAAPARAAALVGLKPDEDTLHLIVIARAVALLSIVAALWTGATAIFIQACVLGR